MTTKKINKGFTLIEVLLVMVLIGVLLSIGLVSLNTEDRLIETRNNTRQTHIQTLESAITQYKLQEGSYPTGLNRTYQEICDPEATVCTGFFDIKPFLVPTYIQAIPQDPNDSDTTGGSGYEVAVDIATNTVSVRLKATLQEAGVEIKINDPLPAEPTVTANTQLAATVPNLPPTSTPTVYAIGDTGPGGGKVFYVAGNTYLEAAPSNWSGGTDPGLTWSTGGNQTTVVSGADNSGIGGGFQNTVDIVNQAGNVAASSAAVRARNYTGGGMTDWFLPSKDELAALYAQRTTTDIPTGVIYWSSSELSATNAWMLWDNGGFVTNAGKNWTGRVRPIRMGVTQTTPTVTATGGTITTINENGIWYKVHTFTTNGTFTVTNGGNVDALVVGGGGGGGAAFHGGGGGGGGYVYKTGFSVSGGTISVIVGSGGAGGSSGTVSGTNGGNSVFSTITAYGGGGGGSSDPATVGKDGGSGGGGSKNTGGNAIYSGAENLGYKGGNGSTSFNALGSGGGGGAGGVGANGSNTNGGNGGVGIANSISGISLFYAAGGGGSAYQGTNGVGGSLNVGGNGGSQTPPVAPTAGMNGRGGGGGGAERAGGPAGAGGSGIVIIRYPTTAPPAPTIVTNGRVLDLDAGNTASYPGTGTTWTDLSGNGKTGTLVGSPTYNPDNGGSLVFNGSNWVTIANSFSSPSIPTGSSDRTIVACFKPSSISGGYNHIMHYGNTASEQSYGITTYGGFISTHTWGGAAQFSNYPAVVNSIYCVTLTYNNTRSPRNIFFVNGSFGTTTYGQGKNDDYVINTGTGNGLIVGTRITGGEAYNGNIYRIIIYDRVLTDTEIQQNYNALKGRFGL